MSASARTHWSRLAAASALLAILVAALLLTSTPHRSSTRTWTTWAWSLRYWVLPIEETQELQSIHYAARSKTREQCVACHGDRLHSDLPVHRIHLGSELLQNLGCPECHPSVHIGSRTATSAVSWVDVGFCKQCHSSFPGSQPDSHMREEDLHADCTMCHSGARAIRHAQPYLSQIIAPSECAGCHGGRELPWTPRHEQDGWLDVHGSEALEVGMDSCFACHDFGLKFCDDCHAEKPPSHQSEERWLADHPKRARADTRVCYTCHSMSHCKKCHLNHEDGWLEAHPAFVRERGDSSCTECHSASACSFCHTEVVLSGVSDATASPPAERPRAPLTQP